MALETPSPSESGNATPGDAVLGPLLAGHALGGHGLAGDGPRDAGTGGAGDAGDTSSDDVQDGDAGAGDSGAGDSGPGDSGAGDAGAGGSAARRRGARVALALFSAFAVVFIAISTVEIISQAFGLAPVKPLGSPGETACAARFQELLAALDAAAAEARREHDADQASARFQRAIAPAWDRAGDLKTLCADAPQADDALATLYRLRAAQEAAAREDGANLGPTRRRVAAYLVR